MRMAVALLMLVCSCGIISAQDAKDDQSGKRYGIEPDLDVFPQATPKEALGSVLKAIDGNRIPYLLAQLADPPWVDKRVQGYGGKFQELVRETQEKLTASPEAVKLLRRFYREGEWEENGDVSAAKLKDVQDQVYLHRIDRRWYLENRKKQETTGK